MEKYYENIAVMDEYGQSMTYEDLTVEGKRIEKVVNERCLVFSLCQNSIGSVVGYTAFMNAHIVPVLLNAHLEIGLLHNLLDIYRPKYLWMPEAREKEFPNMSIQRMAMFC